MNIVHPRRSLFILAASIAALLDASHAAKANTEDDVISGQTDLTLATTYSGGVPGTTSDVTFEAGSYSPVAFTLATSSNIGTLDDLSGTAVSVNEGTSGNTSTLTLNGGSNTVSPVAADLLYVGAGGSLTLGGGTGTLNVALTTSGNFDVGGLVTDTSATINSAISGAGDGITVNGTGRLTLAGSNSFTGAVTLNSGLLVVSSIANGGSNSGLGASTSAASNLVFGGGQLLYSGSSATTNRNFTINNGTNATIGESTANTLTIDGAATGSTGGLIISNTPVASFATGAGTVALGGTNSYTGSTTVNAGTLKLDFTQTGAPASNILYNGVTAGTLVMSGSPAITAFDGNPGSALTVTGKASTSNSQAFAGTTLNAGYSAISIAPGAGGQVYLNLGTVSNSTGALVNFQQNGTTITNVVNANGIHIGNSNDASGILGGWATYGAPGATVYAAVDGNGNVTPYAYSTTTTPTGGTITDYGTGTPTNVQLTGSGATGNIALSGTTNGATNINTLTQSSSTAAIVGLGGGTLRFGANGGILVGSNSSLQIGASNNDGTITAGGNASTAGGTLTIEDSSNSGTTLTIDSKIADNGAGNAVTVVFADTGKGVSSSGDNTYITVNGTNTYTGGTYIIASRVQSNSSSPFGSGPVTVLPGGQAYFNTSANLANQFNIAGVGSGQGTNGFASALRLDGTLSGTINLLGDAAIATNNTSALTGSLTGTGSLNLFTFGQTITLGSSTFTDKITGNLAINGFIPGTPNNTSYSTSIKLGGAAALPDAAANSASIGNVIINGPAATTGGSTATLDVAGFSPSTNGLVSTGPNVASAFITNSGASATLTIGDNNANAVFGSTIMDGGTGKTLGITKAGTGTQTFSGANTYNGTTTVNAGTLLYNGTLAPSVAGSGAVTVGLSTGSIPSGTLGGTGTLTVASVTVNANGTLAPGATIGATVGALTLNTTSGITMNGTLQIGINATGGTSLVTTGAFNLGAGSTLNVTGTSGASFYDIVNYSGGSETGTFTTLNIPANYTLNYDGSHFGSNDIELDMVPEPSTWAAGVFGLGALILAMRKRFTALRA